MTDTHSRRRADADVSHELAVERTARADSEAAAAVLRALQLLTQRALSATRIDELLLEVTDAARTSIHADELVIWVHGTAEVGLQAMRAGANGVGPITIGGEPPAPTGRGIRSIPDVAGSTSSPMLLTTCGSVVAVQLGNGWHTGGVEAGHRDANGFSRDDVGLLRLVADQVSLAVDRIQLRAAERAALMAARSAVRRLTLLRESADMLGELTDLHDATRYLAETIVEVTGVASAAVLVEDEQRAVLLVVADTERPPGGDDVELALQRGEALDDVINEERTMLLDVVGWERLPAAGDDPDDGRSHVLAVPLRHSRTVGVLWLRCPPGHVPTGGMLDLIDTLAGQGAQAVERARLNRERAAMYKAERAARSQAEARARAALVLTHVSEGVLLVDRGGVIASWNPAAARMTGLAEATVIGRRADEVLVGWQEIEAQIPTADTDSDERTMSARTTLSFGRVRERELWVSISGVSFGSGTVYAFRDVSDELALERMRTDMLATVSHELRTPLAAMIGAAITLRSDDLEIDAAMSRQLQDMIVVQGERLTLLLDDVLLANRLDARSERLDVRPVSLAEVLDAARRSALASLGSDSGVRWHDVDSTWVHADEQRLAQVVDNLVENAVKYSPAGAPVDVSMEAASSASNARLVVADRGIGIAPGEADRVFEKFYRVDAGMKTGVGGSGLGLFICRRLVETMSGRIWVEPRPGGGSRFIVELPVTAEVATPTVDADA